jgi:hypothetical protein
MNLDDYLYDNNYGCGCGLNDLAARSTKADRDRFFRKQPKLSKGYKEALRNAGSKECVIVVNAAKERAELDALRLRQFRRANPEYKIAKKEGSKGKTTKEIVVETAQIPCANPKKHHLCTVSTIETGDPNVRYKTVQKNFSALAHSINEIKANRKEFERYEKQLQKPAKLSPLEKVASKMRTNSNKSVNKAISKKIATAKRKNTAAEMKRDRYLDKELAT